MSFYMVYFILWISIPSCISIHLQSYSAFLAAKLQSMASFLLLALLLSY